MSGFEEPNYTMVPNDYFELVTQMTEAENKVLAILLRATLGYHRDEIRLSIRELARLTHLDPKSVMSGAQKLEARGMIERTVGKITTVTQWHVVIEDRKLWEKIVKTVPVGTGEIGVKERKKVKEKDNAAGAAGSAVPREKDGVDWEIDKIMPSMTVRQAISEYFRLNVNWDTKSSRQWMEWAMGEKVTAEQVRAAAERWRTDKKFNWHTPNLQRIFESWNELTGRGLFSDAERAHESSYRQL